MMINDIIISKRPTLSMALRKTWWVWEKEWGQLLISNKITRRWEQACPLIIYFLKNNLQAYKRLDGFISWVVQKFQGLFICLSVVHRIILFMYKAICVAWWRKDLTQHVVIERAQLFFSHTGFDVYNHNRWEQNSPKNSRIGCNNGWNNGKSHQSLRLRYQKVELRLTHWIRCPELLYTRTMKRDVSIRPKIMKLVVVVRM